MVLKTDYPLEELERTVCQYIDRQVVTRAAIDPANYSLRLLFGTDTLLSVFPGTSEDDLPWMLVDNCLPFPDAHPWLARYAEASSRASPGR